MKQILVSSQGLARCPSCHAHIRLALESRSEELETSQCPFCEASLAEAARRAPAVPRLRLKRAGQSALLAASLFGAAMVFGGCPGADPAKEGNNGKEQVVTDAAPDTEPPPAAEYGAPPSP